MLTGILWNGSGVLCLTVAWRLLHRTIALLRKEHKSTIAYTICLGIIVGIAGIVCAVFMLVPVTNFITGFTMNSDMYFIINLIAGLLFSYFGVFAVGTVAGSLLRKVCHKDALVEIALILASLVLAQPVVYGWFRFILKNI